MYMQARSRALSSPADSGKPARFEPAGSEQSVACLELQPSPGIDFARVRFARSLKAWQPVVQCVPQSLECGDPECGKDERVREMNPK